MDTPRPATTILLLRDADTPSGMEVFMLQRHRRAGFLPNAWVFPGGRVDAGDSLAGSPRIHGGDREIARMQLGHDEAVAFLVAGIRETFEESGIWLGSGELPWSQRAPLNNGEISLSAVLDAHDATIDLDAVRLWSWWITPRAEPKRYDTRFLLARADTQGRHDEVETVDSRWVCPQWAIENASLDVFPTAPPTWWTLRELTLLPSVDAVFEAAPTRPHRPIEPLMKFHEGGMQLLLPGHPEHPEPTFPGLPHEVRFVDRRWVAVVDGDEVSFS
ncbi:MAG: NUDIX hydrolase [Myxococcota bacterium]